MKNVLLFIGAMLIASFAIQAQTVEFSDDFEAGADNWTLEGVWATTTAQANSGTTSLTDSPGGNYAADVNISATLTNGIDLSAALDATLTFSAIYDIEGGNFDYCYVEASGDGGATWLNVATFLGEGNLSPWTEYSYSLGGFAGNSDVKVRFRFFSDGGYEVDGIYIDDVEITSSDVDSGAPLILHNPSSFYRSSPGEVIKVTELVDISGVASTTLSYAVDGAMASSSIDGINVVANFFTYAIPEQAVGSQVDYSVTATDASVANNAATTETFSYIAGEHLSYDNEAVNFVNSFGPDAGSNLTGCAVRFSLYGSDIKYALIRNYTDNNRPNADFEFHVWANDNGLPGADLIAPFMVTPEANAENDNSPMTRVDLRAFSAELSNITGDVFMGYTVPTGQAWLVQTSPGVGGRTYTFDGTDWAANDDDYHFRLVITASSSADECADATDITSALGAGVNNPSSTPLFNNTEATAGGEPAAGTECFDDGTFENTQWYTFVGDGLPYIIRTAQCGSSNYNDDTQIAVFSGDDCDNLTGVACNEDEDFGNDIYNGAVTVETEEGVTYYILIDGWQGTVGEYCIEFTEVSLVTCDDIALGAVSIDTSLVCFGASTFFSIDGETVIPDNGPIRGFRWMVSSADISGSASPFQEATYQGAFGESGAVYLPELLNDGSQLPAGDYYFTPVVYAGATNEGTGAPTLDFTEGCVITGTSVLVSLLGDLAAIEATVMTTNEVSIPGNNGEASATAIGGSGNYTYLWSNGETTETITGLAAGDYSVTISDVSDCGVAPLAVDFIVELTVGVGEVEFAQAIRLFPNPAKDLAIIEYSFEDSRDLQITVTNAIGQVVWEQEAPKGLLARVELDLSNFTNGVYFVEFNDGSHQLTRRLVVNK